MDNITRNNTIINAMRERNAQSSSQPVRKAFKRIGNWSPQSAANKKPQFQMSDSELESLLTTNVDRSKVGSAFSVAQSAHDPNRELHDNDAQFETDIQSSQLPPNGQLPASTLGDSHTIHQETSYDGDDNSEQTMLVALLREQSLINQKIEGILARGVRLAPNAESINLEAFKSELEDNFREANSKLKFDFSVSLRGIPTFEKLSNKLEYYDELLALKARITDLLLRLKEGTLIRQADFHCTINPAFVQLSNFHEIASLTNDMSYSLQYYQTGLHYCTILEAVELRISEIKSTLIDPTESLAIFRTHRKRTSNQKLNSIFHKLRNDEQRNAQIRGAADSSIRDEDDHRNVQTTSNADTVPKSTIRNNAAANNSANRRRRSRSVSSQRNLSYVTQRNRNNGRQWNRSVNWGPNTSANQSYSRGNQRWMNRVSNSSVQANRTNNSNMQSSRATNSRFHNTSDARNSSHANNHSFRNYADDYEFERSFDSRPNDFYYGPKTFCQSRK
jgi:hypothetical protein